MTQEQESKDDEPKLTLEVDPKVLELRNEQREKTRKEIVEHLSGLCEEHKITNALYLALEPGNDDEMIMYFKGNKILAGKMAAAFNKLVKQEILNELS
jgi:hypothetical protein